MFYAPTSFPMLAQSSPATRLVYDSPSAIESPRRRPGLRALVARLSQPHPASPDVLVCPDSPSRA